MCVINENATAMPDAPILLSVRTIQASIGSRQWLRTTGDVAAFVCNLDTELSIQGPISPTVMGTMAKRRCGSEMGCGTTGYSGHLFGTI